MRKVLVQRYHFIHGNNEIPILESGSLHRWFISADMSKLYQISRVISCKSEEENYVRNSSDRSTA